LEARAELLEDTREKLLRGPMESLEEKRTEAQAEPKGEDGSSEFMTLGRVGQAASSRSWRRPR